MLLLADVFKGLYVSLFLSHVANIVFSLYKRITHVSGKFCFSFSQLRVFLPTLLYGSGVIRVKYIYSDNCNLRDISRI